MAKKQTKKSDVKIKFKPVGERVLVKPEAPADEKSPSGIIIPDIARKEKPERGIIVAAGEGKRNEKGDLIPMRVKVGDRVVFAKYSEQEVTINEQNYFVIKESDILGTF